MKSQSLNPYFSDAVENLVISSDEKMEIKGNLEWESTNTGDTHLILASGEELEIPNGTNIQSNSSDITVSSRQDINLENVQITGSKECP